MSNAFREFVRKIGSGPHTGKDLTREEAATATEMMLLAEATPAQIGAFMIAHRIKRPTGAELAGMLDAYDRLGPKLEPITASYPVVVMGIPYDGRDRTAPLNILTALLLTAAGCPVIMHGGDRMPTKYGVSLVEIWQGLGIDWTHRSLVQVQEIFTRSLLGFLYLPNHFPLAQGLIPYRDQIGKRPPFATLELIWCPYQGPMLLMAGFVHPPTEEFAREALTLRGDRHFITIKGLEGSGDLPRSRTAIIGITNLEADPSFQRLILHPRDYGFAGADVPLQSTPTLVAQMQSVLQGAPSELLESAVWNGGFYLHSAGVCPDLESGLTKARSLFQSGAVAEQLHELAQITKSFPLEQDISLVSVH